MRGIKKRIDEEEISSTLLLFFCFYFRVWEKFHERMQAAAAEITGIKKKLAEWARGVGYRGNTNIQNK